MTLSEIKAAADNLPLEQQEELIVYLVAHQRAIGGPLPLPRDLPLETIEAWIAEDEAGYRRFLESE